ncbi:MAG TPA: NUDIX hydrolase [Candidatus Saccharimonadales bacterium]|nr:NUDIX hydrolase [Candidatus Saccharimonadales bacterium]
MSSQNSLGVVSYDSPSTRRTDYLYRISLKCLVQNEKGEVLVVKETGRDWWDLPGGGMDHGENIKSTIAREMKEEVNLLGDFDFRIISVDEPAHLSEHNFWQLRLVFAVNPQKMSFIAGDDGDEIAFKNPAEFKESASEVERRIYKYNLIASGK